MNGLSRQLPASTRVSFPLGILLSSGSRIRCARRVISFYAAGQQWILLGLFVMDESVTFKLDHDACPKMGPLIYRVFRQGAMLSAVDIAHESAIASPNPLVRRDNAWQRG